MLDEISLSDRGSMPVWTLTAADEQTRDYNITHYRANSNGTVLAFTACYGDGFEVYTLAPGAHNNDDVVGVFRGVIRIVTREAPDVANHIASARGVVCTLPDVAGYLVELLADYGVKNLYSNQAITDGNYYNCRTGHLVFWGLITTRTLVKKQFQRIADGAFHTLDIIESAVNPDGNYLVAFRLANHSYYNLRKYGTKHNFLQEAHAAAIKATSTAKAMGKEAHEAWDKIRPYVVVGGVVLGPEGLVIGATVGTVLYFLGARSQLQIREDLKNARPGEKLSWAYVDERGNEVYWGPVNA